MRGRLRGTTRAGRPAARLDVWASSCDQEAEAAGLAAVVDPLDGVGDVLVDPEEEDPLDELPVLGELDVDELPEEVDSLAAAVDAVLVPRESVR